ncbi:hypothetical protein VKT23_007330 [Stygiomarasmius scandens]
MFHISMTVMQLWTCHQTFLLFKQSQRIVVFLAFTTFLSLVLQFSGTVFYFQYVEFSAGDCSRVKNKSAAKIAHTVGSLYLQIIVLVMSWTRWIQVAQINPQQPVAKIARIMARDNTVVSLLILGFFLFSAIFGLKYNVSDQIWTYGWAWVFGFLNMAPYRMILNLRQAHFESEQQLQTHAFSSPLELTEINPLSAFDDVSSSDLRSTLDSDSVSTVAFVDSIASCTSSYSY